MPQGQVPLTPEDVAKLSPDAAKDPNDAQLAKALEIVGTEATAVG
jgi:hypothetical protein